MWNPFYRRRVALFLRVYPVRAEFSEGTSFEYDHLGDWRHPVLQLCVVFDQHQRQRTIQFLDHRSHALVRDFVAGLRGHLAFEESDARLFALLSWVETHPDWTLSDFYPAADDIWKMGHRPVDNPRVPPIHSVSLPPL